MIIQTALSYTGDLPATLADVKLRARVTGNSLDVDLQSAMDSAALSLRNMLRSPLANYSCVIVCRFSRRETYQVLPFSYLKPSSVSATLDGEAYTSFTIEGANPSRFVFTEEAPEGLLTVTFAGNARPGLKDAFCLLSAATFFESQRNGSVKAARDAILLNQSPASMDGYA